MTNVEAYRIVLAVAVADRIAIDERIADLWWRLNGKCFRPRCHEPRSGKRMYCSDRCRTLVAGAAWQARKRATRSV